LAKWYGNHVPYIYSLGDAQTLTFVTHSSSFYTMKIPAGLVLGVQSLALSAFVGQIPGVGANPLPPKPVGKAVTGAIAPLDQGSVKGFNDAHGNSVFLGIPFAATTGGENRYVIGHA
jgi:hypothetical protein